MLAYRPALASARGVPYASLSACTSFSSRCAMLAYRPVLALARGVLTAGAQLRSVLSFSFAFLLVIQSDNKVSDTMFATCCYKSTTH